MLLLTIDRNIEHRRNQRERSIKRKEKVIKTSFGTELEDYRNSHNKGYVRGKLDKGKIHCSCRMCRYEKHHKIEKSTVKAKHDFMGQKIDEYI